MKKLAKELNIALIAVFLFSLFLPVIYAAEYNCLSPFDMFVYSGKPDGVVVKAYSSNYDNNVYLSMSDLSYALKGTSAQFSFQYVKNQSEGEHFILTGGGDYIAPVVTPSPVPEGEDGKDWYEFKRNRIFYNGDDKKYYTYRTPENDLLMSLTDIQLMMGFSLEYQADNAIRVYPDVPFNVDINELNSKGYFDYINGLVLGDADTGRILFFKDKNKITSIASTTKLMTYILIQERIEAGAISQDSYVTVSESVAKLSKSADGIIEMEAGMQVPFSELMNAMLLASSNESALALAEYAYGSESAFVKAMNQKARDFGLNSAVFYNPHGLPLYEKGTVQIKIQNRMNAEDLFKLSSYVIRRYPQIQDITSMQYATMPTLEYTTANSNALVFNMPSVTGLKTGSTAKAGYCLVASMPVTSYGETHNIILVILGAENGSIRAQMAEMVLKYAQSYYEQNGF